jgi:hypothetical protein
VGTVCVHDEKKKNFERSCMSINKILAAIFGMMAILSSLSWDRLIPVQVVNLNKWVVLGATTMNSGAKTV